MIEATLKSLQLRTSSKVKLLKIYNIQKKILCKALKKKVLLANLDIKKATSVRSKFWKITPLFSDKFVHREAIKFREDEKTLDYEKNTEISNF